MVNFRRVIPAPPGAVLAHMNDPDVIAAWVAKQRAVTHVFHSDRRPLPTTSLRYTSDLSRVPAPFNRFIGSTLEVGDDRSWRSVPFPPGSDDSGSSGSEGWGCETDLDVTATTGGRTGHLRGTLRLEPDDEGTSVTMTGNLRLSGLPKVVASSLRGQVQQLIVAVLIEHLDLVAERASSESGVARG